MSSVNSTTCNLKMARKDSALFRYYVVPQRVVKAFQEGKLGTQPYTVARGMEADDAEVDSFQTSNAVLSPLEHAQLADDLDEDSGDSDSFSDDAFDEDEDSWGRDLEARQGLGDESDSDNGEINLVCDHALLCFL